MKRNQRWRNILNDIKCTYLQGLYNGVLENIEPILTGIIENNEHITSCLLGEEIPCNDPRVRQICRPLTYFCVALPWRQTTPETIKNRPAKAFWRKIVFL